MSASFLSTLFILPRDVRRSCIGPYLSRNDKFVLLVSHRPDRVTITPPMDFAETCIIEGHWERLRWFVAWCVDAHSPTRRHLISGHPFIGEHLDEIARMSLEYPEDSMFGVALDTFDCKKTFRNAIATMNPALLRFLHAFYPSACNVDILLHHVCGICDSVQMMGKDDPAKIHKESLAVEMLEAVASTENGKLMWNEVNDHLGLFTVFSPPRVIMNYLRKRYPPPPLEYHFQLIPGEMQPAGRYGGLEMREFHTGFREL